MLGMELSGITSALRTKFKLSDKASGVLVTAVDAGSSAEEKAVKAGDLIVEVAQKVTSTPAAVSKQIEAMRKAGKKVVLVLVSNEAGEVRFVALNLK